MTQPPPNPDGSESTPPPAWTAPAWSPPPPRGQQSPPNQPPPNQPPPNQPPPNQPPPNPSPPYQAPPNQQPQYEQPQYEQPRYEQPASPPYRPGESTQHLPPWQGNPAPFTPGGNAGEGAHRSRTLALVAAAVVVVVAVAVGIFVLRGTSSDTKTGGAATPEQAVQKIADAATAQDVDTMLSYIDPAESRSVGALISALRSKLGKSGIAAATGVPLPYLALVVKGVQVDVQKVRDDLAFATLRSGTVTATVDPAKLPPAITDGATKKQTSSANLADRLRATKIGIVEVGGRWYLSPTTTILEAIRKQSNLPEPNYTVTPSATGGDSPEGAVTGLVNALNQKDLRGASGYISSKEVPALAYYYDVFANQVNDQRQRVNGAIGGVDLKTEDMTNGLKKVVLNSANLTGPNGKVSYGSGCVVSAQGQKKCIDSRQQQLIGLSQPFFVVEQNAGKWQISPIATVVEYFRSIVADGSTDAFYRRINLEALAPVTGAVTIGQSTTVQLNDAGFAHITVSGTPGSCFSIESPSDTVNFRVTGDAYSGSCSGYAMPKSGKVDAIVLQDGYDKGSVEVKALAV